MLLLALQAQVDFTQKYEQKIQMPGLLLVKFCAIDCEYCADVEDEYDKVAEFFDESDEVVTAFASCRVRPEICQRFGIKEHPSIVMYHAGKQIGFYKGPWHHEVIQEWVRLHLGLVDERKSDFGVQ